MQAGKIAAGVILVVGFVAVAGACSGQSDSSTPIRIVKVEDIGTGSDAWVVSIGDKSSCDQLATALRDAYRGYGSNGVVTTEPDNSGDGRGPVCSGDWGLSKQVSWTGAINVYASGGGMARKICGDLDYKAFG